MDSALRCASVQSWLSVTLKCLIFIYLFLQPWCSSHCHMCAQTRGSAPVEQHDLEGHIAFTQQFYKLCFRLVDSN